MRSHALGDEIAVGLHRAIATIGDQGRRFTLRVLLVLREQPFMLATIALGYTTRRTILRHAVPNLMRSSLIYSTLDMVVNLLLLSGLAYLGLSNRAWMAIERNKSRRSFYLDLAKKIGGPVLEMGCGTGRVLLTIARAGIEIHGLDRSSAMLQVLRDHIAGEPAEVQRRIVVHQGDMRAFRGEQKYPLVSIPFRPMQHMYTVEDQLKALQTAAFHLRDDGVLAFDVFFPRFEGLLAKTGEERLEMEWTLPSFPGRVIRRFVRRESLDKVNQSFSATFIYRTYDGEVLVSEETAPLKMAYYTYPHLKALFLLAGLETVEEYGSFAKAPLDNDATDMVFVLKKK